MKNRLFPFILLYLVLPVSSVFAQIQKPATWTYTFSKNEVKKGETVDLIYTAVLQNDWYIYSSDFDPDLGPMLTSFKMEPNKSYQLIGKLKPQNPKQKFEELWGGNIRYYDNKAVFKQTVKILSDNPVIKGSSEFQTCRHTNGICVAGNEDFEFTGLKVVATLPGNEAGANLASTNPTPKVADNSQTIANIDSSDIVTGSAPVSTDSAGPVETASSVPSASSENPATDSSLLGFALAAFLSGLVALLTPCVFPIIPMTVSYFTNQENGKVKALLYGISIVLIYTLIGTVVSRLNGPAFANFLSTHWIPNVLFFAIFFVFGLSFLGLFEIVLPIGFVN